jgi:hypothetical protein
VYQKTKMDKIKGGKKKNIRKMGGGGGIKEHLLQKDKVLIAFWIPVLFV